jgi:ribonuclease P protein component
MSTPDSLASYRAWPDSGHRRLSLAEVRLCKHSDFQQVYAASRKRQSALMSWFLAPQSEPATPRVGLTVGKVLGKAHERNRIKRRLREVLRHHIIQLPVGFDLVLHPRRTVLTTEFTKLEAEVLRILSQANVEAARSRQLASAKPTP